MFQTYKEIQELAIQCKVTITTTLFSKFDIDTLSDMCNAIVTHFSRQGIALRLIFLAQPGLLRTSTEPRRVIGNYSGKFILFDRTVFHQTRSQTHNLKSFTVPATQQQVYKLVPPSPKWESQEKKFVKTINYHYSPKEQNM